MEKHHIFVVSRYSALSFNMLYVTVTCQRYHMQSGNGQLIGWIPDAGI